MKIVFVSNYYNHHQNAISAKLHQLTGGNYYFIATEEMSDERQTLGYGLENIPTYVLRAYESDAVYKRCQKLINEADVVIAGSAPEYMLRKRIRNGKLVFRYSERPLKNGFQPLKYLPRLFRWHWKNPMSKPIYMLCASAYTTTDYNRFGLFRGRCYKWGYFPEAKRYDEEELFAKKDHQITHVLWCGRFLDWKHPDDAVQTAERLKKAGYRFVLDFIGTGELQPYLEQLIQEKNLEDCVRLLGSMKPEQVREYMEQANIYLFTSDHHEGWGAVLNESMNSACAVVASHAIGAVPFLIEEGENGLIYESGNVDMLHEKVKHLLDKPAEQQRLGLAAYRTITEEWSAETAAERLLCLFERLLAGEKRPELLASGPCSKAEIIDKDWM